MTFLVSRIYETENGRTVPVNVSDDIDFFLKKRKPIAVQFTMEKPQADPKKLQDSFFAGKHSTKKKGGRIHILEKDTASNDVVQKVTQIEEYVKPDIGDDSPTARR